ncbi:MAG: rRNA maturation RNase YbeY [Candidatus Paceibacterota bacterium]|jgi:rRNA maturation RNase YbeY
MGVNIRDLTRQHLKVWAGLPFTEVAEEVLPDWDVSLVFVGAKRAQELNERLRGKDYIPNVLSYALGEKSGEIFICPSEAAKQAPEFHLAPSAYCLLLFIHGLLHIKGWAHSATMEACEQKLLAQFAKSGAHTYPHATTHSNRNRHRHVPDQDGRRRGAH